MVRLLVALLLVLACASPASPQQLTSGEETITVSTTVIGITADTCETGNRGGAYVQVLTNGIYLCLHSTGCTADSGDFRLDAGTQGPQFWVKPASKLRMLRQSADSSVKVQCTE